MLCRSSTAAIFAAVEARVFAGQSPYIPTM
jgi:hypothetical protein